MHLRKEVLEELGLPELENFSPRLLAVVQDEFLGQPELVWQCEIELAVEEAGRRIDRAEHSGWLSVSRGQIPAADWERMTPVSRYAWSRWHRTT